MRIVLLDRTALAAIRFYRRHLSARKGFSCAYRCHTGCASCSTLGLRAIRRHGLWSGLALLKQRLERCGVAHRRFGQPATPRAPQGGPHALQAGFCDAACDGSDLDCLSAPCEIVGGCTDISDCSWRRKQRAASVDEAIYIPPPRPPRPDA